VTTDAGLPSAKPAGDALACRDDSIDPRTERIRPQKPLP